MQILHELEKSLITKDIPVFFPGDTLKVSLLITEGKKTRVQIFQGVVIAINRRMNRSNFVIRKVSAGNNGVERILPFYSPNIDKIEVVKRGRVRRAKLYYLRDKKGKAGRIAEKRRK
jgi:large subunit ribosomal protein L19